MPFEINGGLDVWGASLECDNGSVSEALVFDPHSGCNQ